MVKDLLSIFNSLFIVVAWASALGFMLLGATGHVKIIDLVAKIAIIIY